MVVEITSRQFREEQKKYFDLADQGTQIVLKRGRKQAYVLTPVNEDDLYLSPKMKAKIERSLKEAAQGKAMAMQEGESLDDFLKRVMGCPE